MNEQGVAVIAKLRSIRDEARNRSDVFHEAAQYFPPPYARSLDNISGAFLFHSMEIDSVISELEAVFYQPGDNVAQDVERPGE